MTPFVIAPSILSADIARLGEEVAALVAAGADWIHLDVMDNHYVPNLTFGPDVCKALRQYGITVPIDVHLMVKPVDALIERFAKVGASSISFHPEATEHIDRSIQLIHDSHCQAGLVFNPATPLSVLPYVLDKLDVILMMSVNPGFGGQAFIPSVLDKLKVARDLIDKSGYAIRLAVDGGVNLGNLLSLRDAGADTFVAGSAIFETGDYRQTIQAFRASLLQ